jgi:hypothetical protein
VGILQSFEIKFETVVSLLAGKIVFTVTGFFVCSIYDFKLVFNESNISLSISQRHNKLGFPSHHVPSSIEKSLYDQQPCKSIKNLISFSLMYLAKVCLYSEFLFSSKFGSHTLYDVEYITGRFNLFQRYKANHQVNKSCGRISHSLICFTE